jgi:hypothetical protein
MKPHAWLIALAAAPLLSACFISETSNISEGQLLARGPIALCTPDDPPCRIAVPSGDGYVVAAEDGEEEDLRIRFEALTEAGGVPVWIGEVELREDEETAWSYLVARPVNATVDSAPRFDLAMPGCGEIAPGLEAEAGVVRTDPYACTVTDYALFRTYLTSTYAERFANPAWWADAD